MPDQTEHLLDYVHGRLDEEARAQVEADLDTDPLLRAELAAMQAVRAEMMAEAPSRAVRDAGWQSLSAAIEAERRPRPANENRRFSLLQVAAVAAAAVLSVQGLTYVVSPGGDGAGFVPASVSEDGPVLQIAFRQDARMDEITALLQALDATIVDGPSAMGLVTLEFRDADSRAAALATLEERTDVVELVSQP